MSIPHTFGTVLTGAKVPGSNLDDNFAFNGKTGIIPCSATGTNDLALTPIVALTVDIPALQDGLTVSFVAPANNTGAMRINFNTTGLLTALVLDGTAAVAGSVKANALYHATYRLGPNTWFITNALPGVVTAAGPIANATVTVDSFGRITALSATSPFSPASNLAINGDMWVSQRYPYTSKTYNSSQGPLTNVAGGYICDRVYFVNGAAVNTITKVEGQASGTGCNSYLKIQRTLADTHTNAFNVLMAIPFFDSQRYNNGPIVFSFWAQRGTNFSASGQQVIAQIIGQTGGLEMKASQIGSWPGQTVLGQITPTLTTSWAQYSIVVNPMPNAISQLALSISWAPTGTAGTDDTVYTTGWDLRPGVTPPPIYLAKPWGTTIQECMAFYQDFSSAAGYGGIALLCQVMPGAFSAGTQAAQAILPMVPKRTIAYVLDRLGVFNDVYISDQVNNNVNVSITLGAVALDKVQLIMTYPVPGTHANTQLPAAAAGVITTGSYLASNQVTGGPGGNLGASNQFAIDCDI